jgi:hypothetical protein
VKEFSPGQVLLCFTVGVNILVALVFIVKNGSFTDLIKRFGIYIVIGALFEFYSYWLVFVVENKDNNLYLVHIFTLIEFVVVSWFFGKLFELFQLKFNTILIIVIGAVLIILNSLLLQPIDVYNSFSRTAVQLCFLACCFVGFYLFTQRNYAFEDRAVVKWVLIALLIKYSGSLFLYLFSNRIADLPPETQINIWLINPSLNLLFQMIILIAFVGFLIRTKEVKNEKLKQEYF